jgi:PAS domain S-box-containing protein
MNYQDKSKAIGGVPGRGEEQFREIFNSVKDAMFVETPEGKILDVNRAACEMLGYTREELLAMHVAGIVPPELAARLAKSIQKKTVDRGVYVESESLRKDGVRIPIEVSNTLVDIEGERRVISILRDLTERKRSQADLRESEEKWRGLFDKVKDAVFIETPEGKILEVNRATCALLGYTKEELLTMGVAQIVAPEIAAHLAKSIQKKTVETGVYVESESLCKNGRRVPVEVSNTLIEMKGQKRVVAVLRDISERKRAEAELKRYQEHLEELVEQRTVELLESEMRLRGIFEFTKDAMFIEKPTGEILDVNKATCGMLGYTKEELTTKRVGDVVPPEVAATLAKTIQEKTVQEGVYIETEDMRKDGRLVPVEVSCTLVNIKGEERVIAILRDISERKRAEDALRESEERFRKIFNNTKDAIFIVNPDGSFSDINEAACAMLGYTKEELLGKTVNDIVSPRQAEKLPKSFIIKMAEEGLYFESENIRKDGTRIAVEVGNSMVEIGGEKKILAIFRDITERKKAEKELQDYRNHLERMVNKRTEELARINQDLLAEIAKKEEIQAELARRKEDLEKKNIALKEVLSQIEKDKEQLKSDIIANVEHLMIPILRKVKSKATRIEAKYIEMLRHSLEQMVSSFGRKISDKAVKLSPREIEISNMIRSGMSSKEISELLHLALKTVELQRVNIRKKLGIAHRDINLTTYLQSI